MNIATAFERVSEMDAAKRAEFDKTFIADLKTRSDINTIAGLRNWEPRNYQQKLWNYLVNGGKRACAVWHRRSGKDDVALNWTARAAHQRVGEYWHLLPEAAQGRKVVWDAVSPHTGRRRIDQAFPLEMREKTREQDMVIQFKNGSLWRVVGSDNYESLLGSTPAGVVFSEWALADPNAWAFLRPILMENGGWAIFITTPRGTNHARTTYDLATQEPEWFAQILKAIDTGVFRPDQLDTELRELQHDYGQEEGAALFEQEYNCSFEIALVGSYYGSYLTRMSKLGRIGSVPVDRGALVHTGWDLGVGDSTAIWFVQCVGKERRIVDYHEGSGVGLDEYARVLAEKQKEHGWIYGFHYFPHDVQVRELGNRGLSRVDTLAGLGIKAKYPERGVNINDQVNAVRRMLDSTWMDEKRCERGLNCLRNFRREWSDKLKMFSDSYLHDWSSHGAFALQTFACGYREAKERPEAIAKIPDFSAAMPHQRGTGWMGGL
jgi:phage terminase large subunit